MFLDTLESLKVNDNIEGFNLMFFKDDENVDDQEKNEENVDDPNQDESVPKSHNTCIFDIFKDLNSFCDTMETIGAQSNEASRKENTGPEIEKPKEKNVGSDDDDNNNQDSNADEKERVRKEVQSYVSERIKLIEESKEMKELYRRPRENDDATTTDSSETDSDDEQDVRDREIDALVEEISELVASFGGMQIILE